MRVVPVGRDLWVRNHNGLQVKSPVSQVSAGTQSESFQGKEAKNTCIFNSPHSLLFRSSTSGHRLHWLQPACEEHRIYTHNTSMLELAGHFINYLLLASQRKWLVGVYLLWYFQSFFLFFFKKSRILKRGSKSVHVLRGRRLKAGGECLCRGSLSLSCLELLPPSDWHITFYKEHRPFQLTWGLTPGRVFFGFFFFF